MTNKFINGSRAPSRQCLIANESCATDHYIYCHNISFIPSIIFVVNVMVKVYFLPTCFYLEYVSEIETSNSIIPDSRISPEFLLNRKLSSSCEMAHRKFDRPPCQTDWNNLLIGWKPIWMSWSVHSCRTHNVSNFHGLSFIYLTPRSVQAMDRICVTSHDSHDSHL